MYSYRSLVEQLVSQKLEVQTAARLTLLSKQEMAVEGLSNIYSGGVNDAQGSAILEIIAEIGGFEAMALLRNVFAFEDHRPVLRFAAARGLLRNQDNLSEDEVVEITRFLAEV